MTMNRFLRVVALVMVATFLAGYSSFSVYASEEEPKKKKVKWVKVKDGLKSLIAYGKTQGDMKEDFNDETKAYRRVKEAIDHKELRKGESSEKIIKEYGSPTITLTEEGGDLVKMVYKPGKESFFDGNKVYLFFNDSDQLIMWEIVEAKEKMQEEK